MLKKTGLLISCLLVVGSGMGLADQSDSSTQTLEFSGSEYHRHYQESIPDYETGWMNGIHLSYKNQNNQTKEYWQVIYETSNHNDSYFGGLQDAAGNYMGAFNTTTKNSIKNYEVIYANPIGDSKHSYAYIGIGSYSWDRTVLGQASQDVADSTEKYSWKYIPIGYRNEYSLSDKWDGAVNVEMRNPFQSIMKAIDPSGIDPFQVNLGRMPGFKIECPFEYKMNNQWSLSITPWYEYWAIGQSNYVDQTVNGVVQTDGNGGTYVVSEPSSKALQYGINLGVKYIF